MTVVIDSGKEKQRLFFFSKVGGSGPRRVLHSVQPKVLTEPTRGTSAALFPTSLSHNGRPMIPSASETLSPFSVLAQEPVGVVTAPRNEMFGMRRWKIITKCLMG